MNKAASTRLHILQEAFALIYANGYRATSVDDIIAQTAVTKGAFYYHFKTKDEMGIAMVKELMHAQMQQTFLAPLEKDNDPLRAIYKMMHSLLINNPLFQVEYGCPAVNLIEEMGGTHPGFQEALGVIIRQWQKAVEKSLEKGKAQGLVRAEVAPKQVSLFIASGYSGIRNMGKLFGPSCYATYLKSLNTYLEALRKA